jgi:hypothetical protein
MDGVRPSKISCRKGRLGGSYVGVAPRASEINAGVGRSWGIKRTGQTIQWGFRKVATAKHGQDCSICRSGLQVPLSAEWEGFLRPASQRAAMAKGLLTYIPWAMLCRGPLGCKQGFWGGGIHYGPDMHPRVCHVECSDDVNVVRVLGWHGDMTMLTG